MSKVLVTGAHGNIGQFVVAELLNNGHSVVALDLPNPSTKKAEKQYRGKAVTTIWGDLRDSDSLSNALEGVDAVVHMAAIIPPLSENQKELATEINVNATSRMIELMEASPTAKRLVFASSMGIYGKDQNREPPLKVDDPASPDDHYGVTKVQAEEAVRASSLNWSILRIAACPPVNLSSARSHKGNNPFEYHPDARVEIVHPADAGAAFARAAVCDEAIGQTFFVGGGESCRMSHYELASRTLMAAGLSKVKRDAFKDEGRVEMYGDWLDTEKGQALFNYQNHSAEDFFREFRSSLGLAYYLVKAVGPLATCVLVKKDGFS